MLEPGFRRFGRGGSTIIALFTPSVKPQTPPVSEVYLHAGLSSGQSQTFSQSREYNLNPHANPSPLSPRWRRLEDKRSGFRENTKLSSPHRQGLGSAMLRIATSMPWIHVRLVSVFLLDIGIPFWLVLSALLSPTRPTHFLTICAPSGMDRILTFTTHDPRTPSEAFSVLRTTSSSNMKPSLSSITHIHFSRISSHSRSHPTFSYSHRLYSNVLKESSVSIASHSRSLF
jgi:hypothetical protein